MANIPGIFGMEGLVILIVALLIFGKNLPEVMRALGRSINEFKKGMNEVTEPMASDASRPVSWEPPRSAPVETSAPATWTPPAGWVPPPGWTPPASWVPPPGWAPPGWTAPPAPPPAGPSAVERAPEPPADEKPRSQEEPQKTT
ncbi:twin-arginine translocase TatA/TatE family subunit [bacterium]|nr:twin-arginine translocase TatA/TatE family subunit [bacterium]